MKLVKLGRLMTRAAAYAPVVVEPGTGEVLYVGQAPSASGVTWYMAPANGTVSWVGYDPTIVFADLFVIMQPGQGSATWTGLQPGLLMPVNMAPGVAAASWTGPLPTFVIVDVSGARILATGESDALAIDFTDDYFQSTTGQYGSLWIVDTGTPANDKDGLPYSSLSYTSPSAKYCLQSDGTYQMGAHNLYTSNSEDASAWTAGGSVGITVNTSITPPTGISATKSTTAEDANATGYSFVTSSVSSTIVGATYELTLYAEKETSVSAWADIQIDNYVNQLAVNLETGSSNVRGGSYTHSVTSHDANYWKIVIAYTAATAVGAVRIFPSVTTDGTTASVSSVGVITFTAVQLRRTPSVSTYLATTSSARYALPYEWDTGASLLGIRVEEARTNLLTYSEQFDNAAWTKSNGSITANAATAPDGETTADTFDEGTNTSVHSIFRAIGTTASSAYTFSANLEYVDRQYYVLSCSSGTNGYYAVFDLINGTVGSATAIGSGTATSASITQTSQGYRCSITGAHTDTTTYCLINAVSSAAPSVNGYGQESFTGTSKVVNIWGAQLELGSFPTSYIQTISASASRLADNISLATSAFPFDASAGTVYAQIVPPVNNSTGRVWQLAQAASDSSHQIAVLGNEAWVYSGGVQYASFTNVVTSTKTAFAFASNDANFSKDGDIGTDDTSVTMPSGVDKLTIGTKSSGGGVTNWCSCHIKQLMYLPRRMSNADMVTLTSG